MTVAFLAGLLSFLSPCVLPLVPSYLSFITGVSGVTELESRRHLALVHAMLFVAGFSIIFIALGATATELGLLLKSWQAWVERVGGALIVLFGLYTLGVLRIGVLSREARVQLSNKPLGFLGSVLVGMAFGAGWTPCIGPILGSILLYASSRADLGEGLRLLAAYSLGLAIPFLVAAWALEAFLRWFQRFRRYVRWVEIVAGVLLVAVGLLLLTGSFTVLSGWMQGLTPGFLRSKL
ncbi:MAG TPA: cytochrome c biogenesis protein CcdA [Gemmatimonadales bacterium]|nr:cytochrome c biogenesis protein CcdA [Gemmatimonadales bacterium]